MFKSSHRKKVVAAGIFAGLLVLSVFALTGTASGQAEKITICHCTGSSSNPIEILSVSINAWEEDGGRKHGPHHECTPEAGIATDVISDDGVTCGGTVPP